MQIQSWKNQNVHEEAPYATDRWETFSDLMAGLLLVFVLTLSAFMVISAQESVKSVKRQEELSEKRQQLDQIQQEAEQRLGVRSDIIESLKFSLNDYDVEVDPTTGALRIGGEVLFDEDESNVKLEGQKVLDDILHAYALVFFEQGFEQHLSRIIVEGHTNDNAGYLYNLDLSQRRAFEVMNYLLNTSQKSPYQGKLRQFLVASGRSFTDLIYTPDGQVDKVRSRRIEMKFTLKDEEAIHELKQMLQQGYILPKGNP